MQAQLDEVRGIALAYPMIPALKATVAHFANDLNWRTVRPPLLSLPEDQCSELVDALQATGFEMPGLAAAGNKHD